MMDYKDLLERADKGQDFKNFVSGNIGSYLIKKAEQEELKALRKLATVPPDDRDQIYKLQLAAATPRLLVEWIADVIHAGADAKWQIEQLSND